MEVVVRFVVRLPGDGDPTVPFDMEECRYDVGDPHSRRLLLDLIEQRAAFIGAEVGFRG